MVTRADVKVKVRFPDGTLHHFPTMYQAHKCTGVPYGTLKRLKCTDPTAIHTAHGYRFKFHPEA